MNKSTIVFLFVVFIFLTSTFSFVNIGAGYSFSNDSNNWLLRIGYEEQIFSLTADYVVSNLWYISGLISFSTEIGLGVGPFFCVVNDLKNTSIATNFGAFVGYSYKEQLEIKLMLTINPQQPFSIVDATSAKIRFYVPDPPGMKMADKLYLEANYSKQRFFITVGFLEPF
ncbi:MAG: hypothetical protein ACP5PP_01350 [Fervidobacterium sp.]|jgi:hypothetical protein